MTRSLQRACASLGGATLGNSRGRDRVMEMQSEDAMISEEESYGPILVNRLEVNEREGAILCAGGKQNASLCSSRAAASRRTT